MQLFAVDTDADKSCTRGVKNERTPISFPAWKEVLSAASMPQETKDAYRRDILAFLHHCKVRHAPATIMLTKRYLEELERQGERTANRVSNGLSCEGKVGIFEHLIEQHDQLPHHGGQRFFLGLTGGDEALGKRL